MSASIALTWNDTQQTYDFSIGGQFIQSFDAKTVPDAEALRAVAEDVRSTEQDMRDKIPGFATWSKTERDIAIAGSKWMAARRAVTILLNNSRRRDASDPTIFPAAQAAERAVAAEDLYDTAVASQVGDFMTAMLDSRREANLRGRIR